MRHYVARKQQQKCQEKSELKLAQKTQPAKDIFNGKPSVPRANTSTHKLFPRPKVQLKAFFFGCALTLCRSDIERAKKRKQLGKCNKKRTDAVKKKLALESPRLAKKAAHQSVLAKLCYAGASKQSKS